MGDLVVVCGSDFGSSSSAAEGSPLLYVYGRVVVVGDGEVSVVVGPTSLEAKKGFFFFFFLFCFLQ